MAAALAAAATVAFALVGSGAAGAQGGGEDDFSPPNVVVVMSDDQTQDSMRYMPKVNGLIGAAGATFPSSVVNWPLCCPSRATFLTGRYAHNHKVLGNAPPFGGFGRLDISETLPVWLQRAGYATTHIGKFLNGYENSTVGVPPGWTEWHGSKRTYNFYGYQLLEGGNIVTYGSTDENPDSPAQPELYSTDLYTQKAVESIQNRAPSNDPFFLSVAYLAPHSGGPNPAAPNQSRCNGTAKPAPRHIGAFGSEPLPLPPNFNEADASDKPAGLATRPYLTDQQIANATKNYRCRAESLLAIDEGVERIVNALSAAGELDDTLLIYTSDNGFFHGEHRVQGGKNRVYEEAIRVPLMMRGPGIPEGVTVDDLTINADLAATILDAAGASAPFALDGRSLLPFIEHPRQLHGRELLIEQKPSDDDEDTTANGVFYNAIRNATYTYVENGSGERELYDLAKDPFQLQNQIANPAYAAAAAALASRLAGLRACAGEACHKEPSLNLKLPRSVTENGRSCREPRDFIARIRGSGAPGLLEVRFAIGPKKAGHDRSGPFKKRILPRLLRDRKRPTIHAETTLLDGRLFSIEKQVRICR